MSRGAARPYRLVVVRHGPAMHRDPRRWPDDDDRPLRPDGRRSFAESAVGLANLLTARGNAASSRLTRARQTMEILGDRWRPGRRPELWEELRPEAPAPMLLDRVAATIRPGADLVIVGHEPLLSRLVGLAVSGEALPAVRFSKGGAVALRFAAVPRAGGGQIGWAMTRNQLGALRKRPGLRAAEGD